MSLVDAETSNELGPLVRGSTVNLADIGTNQLSAVLTWSGSPIIKSVAFYLDSATVTATENGAPWALLGDNARQNLEYVPWTATIGTHTIVAELFDQRNRNGDLLCAVTYTFTIVDGVDGVDEVVTTGGTGPVSNQISAMEDDPEASNTKLSTKLEEASNTKLSTKLEDWLLPILVGLAMVVTTTTVVVQRRRSQRSSALELNWDEGQEYADCGASVDHTDFVDPASKTDAEWEWDTIA